MLKRWISLESWGTDDWQVGFGRWDEAIEIYVGPWIIRFSPQRADFR